MCPGSSDTTGCALEVDRGVGLEVFVEADKLDQQVRRSPEDLSGPGQDYKGMAQRNFPRVCKQYYSI